jgi:hypothetical protein
VLTKQIALSGPAYQKRFGVRRYGLRNVMEVCSRSELHHLFGHVTKAAV